MGNIGAILIRSLITLGLGLGLGGCLPAYVPGADPQAADNSGPAGSPDLGEGAPVDLAGAPAADLGGTPPADLAGAPPVDLAGSDLAVLCTTVQSTAALSSPSGHHNAGQECQGCHGAGGGAPRFYVGGTLYNAVTAGAAVVGATIHVTDAAGKQVSIVSATNGNFWTATALTYPLKVDASLCPSTMAMAGTVASPGACNNCHNSTFRVHVP